jgi:uncharacterized protein Yka (UPF0111/DUF47 family)
MTPEEELNSYKKRIDSALKLDKLDKARRDRYQAEYKALLANNAALESFKTLSEDINLILDQISDDLDYVVKSFKDSVTELTKGKNLIQQQKSALDKLADTAKEVLNIRRGDTDLDDKRFKKLVEQTNKQQDSLRIIRDTLRTQGKSTEEIDQQIDDVEKIRQGFAKVLEIDRKINRELGFIPEIAGGIDKALSKLGLPELGFAEALQETKRLGQEADSLGLKFSAFGTYINLIKNNFADALTPANLFQSSLLFLIDAAQSLDEDTGKLAKNFGISYIAAAGVSDELNTAANASYLLNVNTQNLTEAFIELNNQFGTFAQVSTEALTTFTRLTKEAGLSTEAASMLFRTTTLTGKEVEATTKEFLGEATALAATNGVALNQKQILESVKDVSQATLLSFGGQADKLAEAIVQAKLLGVNLDQVEDIAQSLLQFESSISSELEAELLTGKQLNLERARLAAINNDLATVASEIAKQVGTAAEFTAMNVIQQEALAKSVGLTREDLAKSLIEREALVKLSGIEGKTAQERFNNLVKEVGLEEAKKRLGDETLANQLAGQSVQERFTASIEKLKEVFVSLAEPLIPILDIFAKIAETVAPIAGFIGQIVKYTIELGKYLLPIYGLYKLIQLSQNLSLTKAVAQYSVTKLQKTEEMGINAVKLYRNKIESEGLLKRIAYNAQLLIGLLREQGIVGLKTYALTLDDGSIRKKIILRGFQLAEITYQRISNMLSRKGLLTDIGKMVANAAISLFKINPLLGIAGTAIAAASGFALYNKFKGDDVVSGGYGKRTLLAPEGAIQLNDKDTVIAGTDLGGGTQQSSGGGSVNMAPLVAELQAIKTLLNTVLTKEGTININGATVATAIYPDIQRMSRLKDFKTQ